MRSLEAYRLTLGKRGGSEKGESIIFLAVTYIVVYTYIKQTLAIRQDEISKRKVVIWPIQLSFRSLWEK
jgi:hypothetical protein